MASMMRHNGFKRAANAIDYIVSYCTDAVHDGLNSSTTKQSREVE
jgi:hypothetical protein